MTRSPEERLVSLYLTPGAPPPTPPAAQPNSYLMPTAVAQQLIAPLAPSPPQTPEAAAANGPTDPRHATLISEWHAHHGDAWTRADALHPAVRCMIDARERMPRSGRSSARWPPHAASSRPRLSAIAPSEWCSIDLSRSRSEGANLPTPSPPGSWHFSLH